MSSRNETPSLVRSVRTFAGFPAQHNACFPLPKERGFDNLSRKTKLMAGGHGALEEEATHRHEMPSPILSGRTLACFQGQHHAGVCLCRKTAAKLDQGLLQA